MPDGNLVPQPDRNLVPGDRRSFRRFEGKWAMIVSGAGIVGAWFSTIFHWGTWVLDYLQTADFLNTRFLDLLRWLFSPDGAHTLTGLFLIAFIVAAYRTVHSNVGPERGGNRPGNVAQISGEDIEELRNRAAELEGEKASLEERIKTLSAQHQRRIEDWEKFDWLVSLATVQANDITDHVRVERVYFCYHNLDAHFPHIVFGVAILNKSVFEITVEDALLGSIETGGEPLLRDKRFTHNPKKIAPISEAKLTIEQRLSPEEVALVAKCDEAELRELLDFRKLVITIGGRTQPPPFERTRLKLPRHMASQDTSAATEIASLKAQLEEVVNSRKPDITGEIKEVFFDKRFSPASGALSDHFYNDYNFFIRVYVANHGAATTIKEFKLTLGSNGRRQDGDRETLEGWHVQRQTGKEDIVDVEASNDVPLEHGRNGWLRFAVRDVQESRIRYGEDDPMPEMELELYAVDKYGTPHKLNSLPQSRWQENALWILPRVEHVEEMNS